MVHLTNISQVCMAAGLPATRLGDGGRFGLAVLVVLDGVGDLATGRALGKDFEKIRIAECERIQCFEKMICGVEHKLKKKKKKGKRRKCLHVFFQLRPALIRLNRLPMNEDVIASAILKASVKREITFCTSLEFPTHRV